MQDDLKEREIKEIADIYIKWVEDPNSITTHLATALQFYIRRKVLKGRIGSSEKMLELWTINGCPTASGCKYINELEQQLKSEE